MHALSDSKRNNQRRRTRKDLLVAAARLLKEGRRPTMDEVAEEALVSRATAYRYFPNVEALLIEAPLDSAVPDPKDFFAGEVSTDPEERAVKVEAALHDMCYQNEAQLRLMLSHSLIQPEDGLEAKGLPRRQNRRIPLIHAALAPSRNRLKKRSYEKLCAALALIFGTESMIVFKDVLQMDEGKAREVKSWALHALIQAAFEEPKTARPVKK